MNGKLNEAIIEYLDDEIRAYELAAAENTEHSFSKQYLRKKKSIIRVAENRERRATYREEYVTQRSLADAVNLRRIAILVAVLIMIMAAAVGVVAAVKAYIRYNVEHQEKAMRITFEKTEDDNEFVFEYIEPRIPEGFVETSRVEEEQFLLIRYESKAGEVIEYSQGLPDALALYFENEDHVVTVETLGEIDIIVSVSDYDAGIMFNDGRYIYDLFGKVDINVLKEMAQEIINRDTE